MADEPDYEQIANKIGSESIDHLETIIKEEDPFVGAKATYLASLIPSQKSINVLKLASQNQHPEVRVASIFGVTKMANEPTPPTMNLTETHNEAITLLKSLKNDSDIRVKNEASKSLDAIKNQ